MMKTNYHTHTYRCMHALNVEDEMYVLSAIEAGLMSWLSLIMSFIHRSNILNNTKIECI